MEYTHNFSQTQWAHQFISCVNNNLRWLCVVCVFSVRFFLSLCFHRYRFFTFKFDDDNQAMSINNELWTSQQKLWLHEVALTEKYQFRYVSWPWIITIKLPCLSLNSEIVYWLRNHWRPLVFYSNDRTLCPLRSSFSRSKRPICLWALTLCISFCFRHHT